MDGLCIAWMSVQLEPKCLKHNLIYPNHSKQNLKSKWINAKFLSSNNPIYLTCRATDDSPMQSEVSHFGVIFICYAGKNFPSIKYVPSLLLVDIWNVFDLKIKVAYKSMIYYFLGADISLLWKRECERPTYLQESVRQLMQKWIARRNQNRFFVFLNSASDWSRRISPLLSLGP